MSRSSLNRHISSQITSLELTGGMGCETGKRPDLIVQGGSRFHKECCFLDNVSFANDVTIAGNLSISNDGAFSTITTDTIIPLSEECVRIEGNLCVDGYITGDFDVSGVPSFSAGTTGLTPNTPQTGPITLGGTLNVSNGGTGDVSFPTGAFIVGNGAGPLTTATTLTFGVGSFPNPNPTITNVPTPYNASDVVPKSYVDAAVANLSVQDAVIVGTSSPLTATYSNGTLGVGSTLTNSSTQGFLVIDTLATTTISVASNGAVLPQSVINVVSTAGFHPSGAILIGSPSSSGTRVTYTGLTATSFTGCSGGVGTLATGEVVTSALIVGDRVLVKNQTSSVENGIYDVTNVGSTSTNWVLTRSNNYDNSTPGQVNAGDFVLITEGISQAATGWVQTQDGSGVNQTIIIGTDDIVFTQFSGAGSYLAGTGLTLSGTTFSITNQIVGGTTAANQVPQITYNNQGQITSVGTTTLPFTTQDEGNLLSNAVNTLNFVGAGVTATNSGSTTTVTIPGIQNITSVIIPNNFNASQKGVPVGGLYRSGTNASATSSTFTITSSFVSAGTTLTVTATSGVIQPGMFLSGGTVTSGTQIIAQLSGSTGSTGTYQVDQAQAISTAPTSVTYNLISDGDTVYVRTV